MYTQKMIRLFGWGGRMVRLPYGVRSGCGTFWFAFAISVMVVQALAPSIAHAEKAGGATVVGSDARVKVETTEVTTAEEKAVLTKDEYYAAAGKVKAPTTSAVAPNGGTVVRFRKDSCHPVGARRLSFNGVGVLEPLTRVEWRAGASVQVETFVIQPTLVSKDGKHMYVGSAMTEIPLLPADAKKWEKEVTLEFKHLPFEAGVPPLVAP